jgi:hypothetical protein
MFWIEGGAIDGCGKKKQKIGGAEASRAAWN